MTLRARNSLIVAGCYLLCHAAFFIFDLHHPDAILFGDRAAHRAIAIAGLVGGPTPVSALARNGPVGDYIAQAVMFAVAGRIGILVGQIALGLAGALFCQAFARGALKSDSAALATALVYIVLPESLDAPHTIVSEAVCNPLLIVGVTWLCAFLKDGDSSHALRPAALMLGLAALVRPQFLLLPVGLVPALRARNAPKLTFSSAAAAALLFYAPTVVGTAAVAVARSLDPSWQLATEDPDARNDIPYHLWSRATSMSAIGHFALPETAVRTRSLGIGAFVEITAQHPSALAGTLVADVEQLVIYPGRIQLLSYTELFRSAMAASRWHTTPTIADGGPAPQRTALATAFGAITVASEALWLAFLCLAVVGAVTLSRGNARAGPRWRFVAFFGVYSLIVPFAAGGVRWDHRTPVDFILATLACAGVRTVVAAWRGLPVRARAISEVP